MVNKRKRLFKATVFASIFGVMVSGILPRSIELQGPFKNNIAEAATLPNLVENPTFHLDNQTTTIPNWSFTGYLNKNQPAEPYSPNLIEENGWFKVDGSPNSKAYVRPDSGGILLKLINTEVSQEYIAMRHIVKTIPGKTYTVKFSFNMIENTNDMQRYSWFVADMATKTTLALSREFRDYTGPQTATTTFTAMGTESYFVVAFEDAVQGPIDGYSIFKVHDVSITLLDTESPKITVANVTTPEGYTGVTTWTNKNTSIHFTATDDNGIDPTTYEVSTDNGNTWSTNGLSNGTTTGVDYTVSNEGTTNIQVRVKDDSGNQSNPGTDSGSKFTVRIDKEVPMSNYVEGQLYNRNTAENITFSDALSGIDTALLDGISITSGVVNPADGTHNLVITDHAGNKKDIKFTVDKTILPPEVSPISDVSTRITGTAEANSTVNIKLQDNTILTTTAGADGSYSVDVIPKTLYAGDVVSVTATDVAGNTSTETNVTVTAESKKPVDPTDPTNPVGPVNPTDPEDPHEQGTKTALSIDYVSNFRFGEQEISGHNKVYTAQLDTVKQASNNSIIQVPNFIQVTDQRRTNTGWKLTVQQNGQFKSGNNEITGAELKLNNPFLNSSTAEQFKPEANTVTLDPNGAPQDVAFADQGKGLGTWTIAYGQNRTEGSTSVTLFVPGAANKVAGAQYKTSLTWTLSDTPL
ncbi:WxL domain-containing protein [Gottfriedia acidiceleris]|uniref:WxL domain-containing protein n=1 Tax=Gottfriedia acidiceleris TaxID=371036 RepID=UPI0013EB1AAF|nr:WxL domain-containing protein [Gottfriedia acidiceleris]